MIPVRRLGPAPSPLFPRNSPLLPLLFSLFLQIPQSATAWDLKNLGEPVDNIDYFRTLDGGTSYELLGEGKCRNAGKLLQRLVKQVPTIRGCSDFCTKEKRCSGFAYLQAVDAFCEIYGSQLIDSTLMTAPPWTLVPGGPSRPERADGAMKWYQKFSLNVPTSSYFSI